MNKSTVMTFFEHQLITKEIFEHDSDFTWLLQKVEQDKLVCFNIAVRNCSLALKVSHYIGVIKLPSSHVIEILPKVINTNIPSTSHAQEQIVRTRTWVSRMFFEIHEICNPQSNPLIAPQHFEQNHNSIEYTWIWPLVQQWFNLIDSLQNINKYQDERLNSPQAQGKLLIKEQMRHNAFRPHYRFTNQTNLIHDGDWGRYLFTILTVLKTINIPIPYRVHHKVKRMMQNGCVSPFKLMELDTIYNQLNKSLNNSAQVSTSMFTNTQRLLHVSKMLISIITQQLSVSPTLNQENIQNDTPAILIDMNTAFEQWISKVIAKRYEVVHIQPSYHWLTSRPINKNSSEYLQVNNNLLANSSNMDKNHHKISRKKFNIARESIRKIQPDVVIDDKKTQLKTVIDVKYKKIGSIQDIKSSDLYQISAYAQFLHANEAWLVFPRCNEEQKSFIFSKKSENANNCFVRVLFFDCEKSEFF